MKKISTLLYALLLSHDCQGMEPKPKKAHTNLIKEIEEIITTEAGIILDIIAPGLEEVLNGEQPAIAHNKYKDITTHTRKKNSISTGEKKYISKREKHMSAALCRHLSCNFEHKKLPTIACIFSGGGYRAMLGALGSLKGLEKTHLLKFITYTSALSGSTWAIAPWISTQMSLAKLSDYIQTCIEKPLCEITQAEKLLIADMIAVRKLSQQKTTLVDIYGGLLGNRLLECMGDKRHMSYLSEQTKTMQSRKHPYPIYTAVSGNKENTTSWYTCTPHKIANITHGLSIPTYGCGRTYSNGTSTNNAPELPLSLFLGTWGSAFAANWETIIEAAEEQDPQYATELEFFKKLIAPVKKDRPIPCELRIPNFTAEMNTPISTHKNLQLVDAGTDINLPYPPVSGICPERKADILIFFDNSAGPLGKQLIKCEKYAHANNLTFPAIDKSELDQKTVSIFTDNNPNTPLVIYMPGMSDHNLWDQYKTKKSFKDFNLTGFDFKKETEEGFCTTSAFQYTREHSQLIMNQTEFNVRANKNLIKTAIKWKIDTV
jgi:hypothetical protein